ncbi:WD repeat-containing protein 25-like isoform X2 [Antedon mediterranea]|uniref:WD repeat-containing protein 25-like isoform X2 n=1 Tax=Antedon mediterranea TaxID=105859 RepID=UPI003AF44469
MDILKGYESSDDCNNEETSDDGNALNTSVSVAERCAKEVAKEQQVDFFSLSSSDFNFQNNSSSLQSPENNYAFELSRNTEPSSSQTYKIEPFEHRAPQIQDTAAVVDTQQYFISHNKHRIKSKRHSEWKRQNARPYMQLPKQQDLQPYVSNKQKQTFVLDHKHIAKKPIGSDIFSTPTLIAANSDKQYSKLPKCIYMMLNEAHAKSVTHVRWNIPMYSHLLLTSSFDNSVKIWDFVDFNTCISTIESHTNGVKDAKWSMCGRQILSGGFDKSVKVHDLQTGKCLESFQTSSSITCLQYHPTEPTLFLAGTYGSTIYCFDTTSGKVVNEYKGNFGEILDTAFLSNGSEFASSSSIVGRDTANRTLMVWDFRAAAVVSNQLYHEKYTCPSLKVHPTENVFLAQSNANYIAIFSSKRPYKLNKFKRYESHKKAIQLDLIIQLMATQ